MAILLEKTLFLYCIILHNMLYLNQIKEMGPRPRARSPRGGQERRTTMKKAEITMVVITEDKAVVTYTTGTTRKYPVDRLPGTVKAWMEAHPAESTEDAEEVDEEIAEAVAEDSIKDEAEAIAEETAEEVAPETTAFILIGGPAPEIATEAEAGQDAPQLPALITAEEVDEEVTEDADKEEAQEAQTVTGEAIKAQALAEVAETAAKATKAVVTVATMAVKVTKTMVKVAPVMAAKMTGAFWAVANTGLDIWYGVTTWAPILARKILFLMAWVVLPTIKAATKATSRTVRSALEAVKVPVLTIINGVAGTAVVAVLAGVRVALASARAIRSGWAMREEIIREDKAA